MAAKAKVKLPVIEYQPGDVDPEAQSPRKGIVCQGCDLENKGRVPGEGAHGEVDIMFVSESPSSWSANNRQVFYGRGGRIIRQAWKELVALDAKTGGSLGMKRLRKWDTYAVQCQVEEGRDQTAKIHKTTLYRPWVWLHHVPDLRAIKMFYRNFGFTQGDRRGFAGCAMNHNESMMN